MHYFEEESFYWHTMFNVKDIFEQYGPRFFDDMEKHCPEMYEAMKAHLANKEIEEFLSSPRKRDDDYYND